MRESASASTTNFMGGGHLEEASTYTKLFSKQQSVGMDKFGEIKAIYHTPELSVPV